MRFENWTIEELFARCMDCDDMTLEMDKEEFAALRIKIAELQHRSDALQSGNSAQPEPVNKTYKLPPNSFSDDELMGMAHGDNPAANAYRELLEFRRNAANGNPGQPVTVPDGLRLALSNAGIAAPESDDMLFATHEKYVQLLVNWVKDRKPFAAPKAPDGQLTPAPEDRLQKAIVDSCMVFLHGCGSLSKNYECDFSDSETELYFCIADVAKKIGVVEETGNRRWSLSQQMKEEINGVYRKYAMRIMEAAPKGV